MKSKNTYQVKAVSDMCLLIKKLAELGPASLSALAKEAGITINKTFRTMETLVQEGFIEKRDGMYFLGREMAKIHARHVHNLKQLRADVNQKLTELREE